MLEKKINRKIPQYIENIRKLMKLKQVYNS